MAFNIAGAPLRDIEHVELEYGIEDWGSFENCVDGLAARSGDDGALDRAYAKIGAHRLTKSRGRSKRNTAN